MKKKSFIILFLVFCFYKLVFNSFTGDFLVSYIFKNYSTGSYSGNVSRFSLFYGLEIKKVSIFSGEDFGKNKIFEAERIAVKYNLPLLFLGRLKLSEIALIAPKINLIEKNKKWNVETLFPSESKPEIKKEEKETEEESSDSIKTYIPVSAFLKLIIHDMDLSIEKEKGEKFFHAKIDGFTFRFLLDTKRINSIPLNTQIVTIFDRLEIGLNPDKEIKVLFEDNSKKLKNPFHLTWTLSQDAKTKPVLFSSKMDIGAKSIPISVKNKLVAPFGFGLSYDLQYEPTEDILSLKELKVNFNEDVWIGSSGKVTNALKKERNIHFEINKSFMNLDPVSKVLNDLPGMPSMKLAGVISLAPLKITGSLNNMNVVGEISIKDLIYSQSKSSPHKVSYLNFQFSTSLDFQSNTKPSAANPLPYIKTLNISKLDLNYNGADIKINGEFSIGKIIDLNIVFDKVNLHTFVSSQYGTTKGKINLKGKYFSILSTDLYLYLDSYRYTAGNSISGAHFIDFWLNGNLIFKENYQLTDILLNNMKTILKNQNGGVALTLNTKGSMNLVGGFTLDAKSMKVETNLTNLIPTLALSSRDAIVSSRESYGNTQVLDGDFLYSIKKGNQVYAGNLVIGLPAFELKDFKTRFEAHLLDDKNATIKIPKFDFSAYNNLVTGQIQGVLFKGDPNFPAPLGVYYPDLDVKISLSSDKSQYMLKGISFLGKMEIYTKLKDFLIKGYIRSKNTNFAFSKGKCPGADCQTYLVNKINMDFPFEHDLQKRTTPELIEGDKSRFIRTYGQTPPPNFTIHQITGPHPYITGIVFEYVKNIGNTPGFETHLDYKENYFFLNGMKIRMLDGVIYGKDVLFNVGEGKPEKMEYSTTLQIRDIDLKQLLPEASRKKIDDGKIKADMNIFGRNLSDAVSNLNLFFSCFQIGKDFGKSAVNVISPQNILTDYIVGSYSVDKMDVQLSKGLVYATILFKGSLLSAMFMNIENNKISQERMPLANFLKRAGSEISKYEK
ncbi:MAG: hypothetical protein HS129_12500 [Leptospiraceae bacterium]|nr:hypothetical protein [Leptospiraceae bacterium]